MPLPSIQSIIVLTMVLHWGHWILIRELKLNAISLHAIRTPDI